MSDDTRDRAAQAVRELLFHAVHSVEIGEGWAEDVVDKITAHVVAEIREREEAQSHAR